MFIYLNISYCSYPRRYTDRTYYIFVVLSYLIFIDGHQLRVACSRNDCKSVGVSVSRTRRFLIFPETVRVFGNFRLTRPILRVLIVTIRCCPHVHAYVHNNMCVDRVKPSPEEIRSAAVVFRSIKIVRRLSIAAYNIHTRQTLLRSSRVCDATSSRV